MLDVPKERGSQTKKPGSDRNPKVADATPPSVLSDGGFLEGITPEEREAVVAKFLGTEGIMNGEGFRTVAQLTEKELRILLADSRTAEILNGIIRHNEERLAQLEDVRVRLERVLGRKSQPDAGQAAEKEASTFNFSLAGAADLEAIVQLYRKCLIPRKSFQELAERPHDPQSWNSADHIPHVDAIGSGRMLRPFDRAEWEKDIAEHHALIARDHEGNIVVACSFIIGGDKERNRAITDALAGIQNPAPWRDTIDLSQSKVVYIKEIFIHPDLQHQGIINEILPKMLEFELSLPEDQREFSFEDIQNAWVIFWYNVFTNVRKADDPTMPLFSADVPNRSSKGLVNRHGGMYLGQSSQESVVLMSADDDRVPHLASDGKTFIIVDVKREFGLISMLLALQTMQRKRQ